MIRTMFKPFFKRFFGLFISMVFVSMLAVALLSCFGSCIIDVRNNYKEFVRDYQNVDELVSTEFTMREKLLSITELDEVEKADARLVVDCYLRKTKEDGSADKTIVARVFSYNEKTNTIFKRYPVKTAPLSEEYVNISVTEKYARNNNFQVGQVVQLGFFEMYENFYISEIVATPEAIYPRANDYVWSDNSDFGYIYASEVELGKGLKNLAIKILEKADSDPEFKEYYEQASKVTGITIPDLKEVEADGAFVGKWANQVMIKNANEQKPDTMVDKINNYYNGKVKIKNLVVKDYLPHIAYMDHALEQVQVAAVFLPVFFYTITMIVVGLFINQIIKTMTPQIGVLMSIGVGNRQIVNLFLLFTVIMGLVSGAIGVPVGYAISFIMSGAMKKTYVIPTIGPGVNPFVCVGAVVGLLLFIILTTFVATRAIFRITPKDATISNEAKRKRLPKPIEKFIDKAPMNIKLGVNSICQNPRRFFVSSFSIFASLVLILLSSFFYVSKNEMIDQSVNRRLNYDCQIYLTQKEEDEEFLSGLEAQAKSKEYFENCYYTYLKVDVEGKNDIYVECLAIDEGNNPLINIPDKTGHGSLSVPKEGLILPKPTADKLKVKKGDTIKINNKDIVVSEVSFQYFHPITYLSKEQMDKLDVSYVSSFIMNVKDSAQLLSYLSSTRNQCLTVFTESLSKDLHGVFDTMDVMIYMMIGFSLGMAFIILCIMSQNALMEQQRQLTIFRAIGFTVLDISNIWTLQSISQLLVSALFGVPAGALAIYILLSLCSSSSQTYPFILSWPAIFMAIGFILLVVTACHLLAMRSIKKWNIADNTRTRE